MSDRQLREGTRKDYGKMADGKEHSDSDEEVVIKEDFINDQIETQSEDNEEADDIESLQAEIEEMRIMEEKLKRTKILKKEHDRLKAEAERLRKKLKKVEARKRRQTRELEQESCNK